MYTYSDKSELAFLKRFWNDLIDWQRADVLEKLYLNDSIADDVLDALRHEEPHVEDFPIPEYPQCMDMLSEMTTEETKKLVTYAGFSIPDLKECIQESDVMWYVLQNYLARNYKLDLPPVEIFVIPDYYEVPFKIRKQSRAHMKQHRSTTRHHSA